MVRTDGEIIKNKRTHCGSCQSAPRRRRPERQGCRPRTKCTRGYPARFRPRHVRCSLRRARRRMAPRLVPRPTTVSTTVLTRTPPTRTKPPPPTAPRPSPAPRRRRTDCRRECIAIGSRCARRRRAIAEAFRSSPQLSAPHIATTLGDSRAARARAGPGEASPAPRAVLKARGATSHRRRAAGAWRPRSR